MRIMAVVFLSSSTFVACVFNDPAIARPISPSELLATKLLRYWS